MAGYLSNETARVVEPVQLAAALPADRIGLVITIDDAEVDQLICERAARKSGLVDRVLRFMSGLDALDYLKKNPQEQVDLILLDMNMPCMTGLEFLEVATKELGPDFADRCLMLLGAELPAKDRARIEAFEVIKGFLPKPLTADALKDQVRRVH